MHWQGWTLLIVGTFVLAIPVVASVRWTARRVPPLAFALAVDGLLVWLLVVATARNLPAHGTLPVNLVGVTYVALVVYALLGFATVTLAAVPTAFQYTQEEPEPRWAMLVAWAVAGVLWLGPVVLVLAEVLWQLVGVCWGIRDSAGSCDLFGYGLMGPVVIP